MQLFYQLEEYRDDRKPVVLTIGNFDGVHRGHLAVLRCAQEFAAGKSQTMVLTFSNHPSKILRPQHPICLLCTLEHRIRLIEACGIDSLLLLPFTNHLAKHSAASFIERLRQHIPFTHLVLGHDATLGRDRQGSRAVMKELGQDWGFNVHYLEEHRYEGHPISSTRIRELLQNGDLEGVEALLGRPFSIYSKVIPVPGVDQTSELSTFQINVEGLCLPPLGSYEVVVKKGEEPIPATAHLRAASSNDAEKEIASVLLEVHLPSPHNFDKEVEVILLTSLICEEKII
ncbi:MAG: hypothetical protein ACHQUC_06425 [Chlamydiales bacterium]